MISASAFAPKEYNTLIQLPWRSWQRVGLIILRSQVRALQGADAFFFGGGGGGCLCVCVLFFFAPQQHRVRTTAGAGPTCREGNVQEGPFCAFAVVSNFNCTEHVTRTMSVNFVRPIRILTFCCASAPRKSASNWKHTT